MVFFLVSLFSSILIEYIFVNFYAKHEMDVRALQFADGTFDIAVDKGNHPF